MSIRKHFRTGCLLVGLATAGTGLGLVLTNFNEYKPTEADRAAYHMHLNHQRHKEECVRKGKVWQSQKVCAGYLENYKKFKAKRDVLLEQPEIKKTNEENERHKKRTQQGLGLYIASLLPLVLGTRKRKKEE